MRVSLSSRNRTGHFTGQLKYSTRYYRMKRAESPMGKPRVYKTRCFQRFARKEKIGDTVLLGAVSRAEKGRSTLTLEAVSSSNGWRGRAGQVGRLPHDRSVHAGGGGGVR